MRNHAIAGGCLGHIQRPQQPALRLNIGDDFRLVPDMIASRQNINASLKQRLTNCRGYAKSTSRIFAIHHDEIEIMLGP